MKPMFAKGSVIFLCCLIPVYLSYRRDSYYSVSETVNETKFRNHANGTSNGFSNETEISSNALSVMTLNTAYHVHLGKTGNRWREFCAEKGDLCFDGIKRYIFGDTFQINNGLAVGVPKGPVTFLQEASHIFFPQLGELRTGQRANYSHGDFHFFVAKGSEPGHGQVTIIEKRLLGGDVLFTSGNLGNAVDFRVDYKNQFLN